MANRWTEKQFKAIRTNGCNILVAAAAGSGKTAVLVERIIRKITAEDGTDVDRMVVVTGESGKRAVNPSDDVDSQCPDYDD